MKALHLRGTSNHLWGVRCPPTNECGSCLIVFRWTIIKTDGWMDEDKQIDTVSYDSAAVVAEQQPKKNGSF